MARDGESATGGARRGRHWLAAGVLAVALLGLHLTNPEVGSWYGRYETAHYAQAVAHPLEGGLTVDMASGDSAPAPVGVDPHYGYRLLPSLVVRALPVPPPLGFVLLDYACLLGAAWLLYRILVAERIRSGLALLCALLFLSFPASTKWMLFYSASPDPLYLLLLHAGYRCIQLRRWGALALVLLAGTFTKETAWLLWPVALATAVPPPPPGRLRDWRPWRGRRGWRAWLRDPRALAIVPSAVAFAVVRHAWPADTSGTTSTFAGSPWAYSFGADIALNLRRLAASSTMGPRVLPQLVEPLAAVFIVYGLVAVVLVAHARRSVAILLAHPPLLVYLLVSLGASVAGSVDLERCMLYHALPVLYVFARIVQEEWAFYGWWPVAAALLAVQVLLSDWPRWDLLAYERTYFAHYMAPPEALRQALSLATAALGFWALRHWCAPRRVPSGGPRAADAV
jgi:hypothetical protein